MADKILEYDLGSASFKELIAKSKFKGFPRFALNSEGLIALQYHGDDAVQIGSYAALVAAD